MGLPHWDLWVSAIGIVGVLLAIVLRFTFARKRPISNHPSCRKCGHDLFGLPETSTRCPECGTDLTAKRAILPYTQTAPVGRRWIVRAIMLVALGLTCWAGWHAFHNVRYVAYLPTLGLLYHMETDPDAGLIAEELTRRVTLGSTDQASNAWIRARVFKWPSRRAVSWKSYWALVQSVHQTGLLSDAQLDAELSAAATMTLRQLRAGDRDLLLSVIDTPPLLHYAFNIRSVELEIDGRRIVWDRNSPEVPGVRLSYLGGLIECSLPPGQYPYTIKAVWGAQPWAVRPVALQKVSSGTVTIVSPNRMPTTAESTP